MEKSVTKLMVRGILALFFFTSFVIAAPADTIRIACIGNSITYGDGISYRTEDSYPKQLEKLLGEPWQVENFGVSGRTMLKKGDYPFWNESAFTNALNFNPHIVIILLGTNDSKPYNWVYKDEFVPDYIAMIDTFKQLPSQPQIYACYPPPAFEVKWDISDAVINHDIIPMIDEIISQTGVGLIDFNTPFQGKGELFPDAIHPSAEGACEMAKVVYKLFTGNSIARIQDVDLVRDKPVQVQTEGISENPEFLVDGDRTTGWICSGLNNAAVIDLGQTETIDLFQTDFGDLFAWGWQYTIEISADGTHWQKVVDQSARTDTESRVGIDLIEATEARLVKLTVVRTAAGENERTVVNDFRVLRSAPVHAPLVLFRFTKLRETSAVFEADILPVTHAGELIKVYRASYADDPVTSIKSYREAIPDQIRGSMRSDNELRFVGLAYKDNLEVISDTLVIKWAMTDVNQKYSAHQIEDFQLPQNYPNPFNPTTSISFYLNQMAQVEVEIFDVTGRLVRHLGGHRLASGTHTFTWDGRDAANRQLSSGIYYYRLRTEQKVSVTRKMVLLK